MSQSSESPRRSTMAPILLKTGDQTPWPEGERFFYLLTRDGLHLCREHPFFRSSVKVETGPSELASHEPFFEPRFPVIPRDVIERTVGFFSRVADEHNSEAAVFLAWHQSEARVRIVVPDQIATVSESSTGYRYPIGVHYLPPADLPQDWVIFGDIHSHVDHPAYASSVDVHDEMHSAGLHIVVGRIHNEPPDLHIEAVADGKRFVLSPAEVIGDYQSRQTDVPDEWMDRLEIDVEYYSWPVYGPAHRAN